MRSMPGFLGVMILVVGVAGPARPSQAEGIEAITRPSADVIMAFVRPGRVA
ncbi:hypothetical protein LCGC14_2371480, partial [marine sediment metagenome]